MIQYTLKCADGHRFDSWFQSAAAFDKLKIAGHVTCAFCGSADVEKAIMSPRLNSKENSKSTEPAQTDAPQQTPAPIDEAPKPVSLSRPGSDVEAAIAKLKAHVEANSDYVGKDFAKEARAMHTGDAPERAIWGETKPEEAKSLIDDGVPIAPLPFTPTRKTN